MEYTIQKLAKLAGISTRTLRYYDEIGLLKPARINSSGYRIYGSKEVDILQQIMFYRNMGVELSSIKQILQTKGFDELKALEGHLEYLLEKREQLDLLIKNVSKSINSKKEGVTMKDNEKFDGFKKKLIEENEEKYGGEIRSKYTDQVIDESNQKLLQMSKEQYEDFKKLEQEILDTLNKAFKTKNPQGELAQKAVQLHRQWLEYTWSTYSKEAHAGLAAMYVEDERFRSYYDKNQPGLAAFLKEAIDIYTNVK